MEEVLKREQLTTGLFIASSAFHVLGEVRSDRLESAPCVLVIGARRQSLADGMGNDIDLRVSSSVDGGPFGEGYDPVSEQFDAVSAVDLAWCEAPLLLG